MKKSNNNLFAPVKIDKNVPLPPTRSRNRWYEIFSALGVGESFLVPAHKAPSVRESWSHWRRRNKSTKAISGRTIPGEGVRFWRVK